VISARGFRGFGGGEDDGGDGDRGAAWSTVFMSHILPELLRPVCFQQENHEGIAILQFEVLLPGVLVDDGFAAAVEFFPLYSIVSPTPGLFFK
jgi:hypothetical protein